MLKIVKMLGIFELNKGSWGLVQDNIHVEKVKKLKVPVSVSVTCHCDRK